MDWFCIGLESVGWVLFGIWPILADTISCSHLHFHFQARNINYSVNGQAILLWYCNTAAANNGSCQCIRIINIDTLRIMFISLPKTYASYSSIIAFIEFSLFWYFWNGAFLINYTCILNIAMVNVIFCFLVFFFYSNYQCIFVTNNQSRSHSNKHIKLSKRCNNWQINDFRCILSFNETKCVRNCDVHNVAYYVCCMYYYILYAFI